MSFEARGRITLEEAPVETGELIDQAAETVQALIREKARCLFVEKPAQALYVRGDRTRFDLSCRASVRWIGPQGGRVIGLSVVKRLIEMHHRSVQAASQGVGQGSTFTIRLRRITPPKVQSLVNRADPMMPRRILMVDDNVDAADSLAMLWKSSMGHDVQTVHGASEALANGQVSPRLIALTGTDKNDHLVKPVTLEVLETMFRSQRSNDAASIH